MKYDDWLRSPEFRWLNEKRKEHSTKVTMWLVTVAIFLWLFAFILNLFKGN